MARRPIGRLMRGNQLTNRSRVADPTRLKAELRIAETSAKDIEIGQPAEIDTRNGIIAGRVSRKDPAATNGSVLADVAREHQAGVWRQFKQALKIVNADHPGFIQHNQREVRDCRNEPGIPRSMETKALPGAG